ncbi:DUF3299 domain-containing protein [Marinimicrobium alkaliphilum]|uniref:DUF3299 domain-containing protein n=1 Tax=Marinimicrobium alkaliphilum TaxID=2202654 RepID=UPI001E370933|nr:DUF3299 domain-containing protein [Marinimicrobium alkaliphilum]
MPQPTAFFTATLLIVGMLVSGLTANAQANSPRTIEWTDLLPEEDLELLLNMPAVDHGDLSDEELAADVPADGLRMPEDDLTGQIAGAISQAMSSGSDSGERTWEDALVSTNVREEFNNADIRIPGFIVPIEFDDTMRITEFFLVPYFGACIHLPPPPPNQIIYVKHEAGMHLDALYTPFWVTGTITTDTTENELALSVYAMTADSVIEYEETYDD